MSWFAWLLVGYFIFCALDAAMGMAGYEAEPRTPMASFFAAIISLGFAYGVVHYFGPL